LNKNSAQNKNRLVTTASRKPLFHPKAAVNKNYKNPKKQTIKQKPKKLRTKPELF
jgi:hypothetical protein